MLRYHGTTAGFFQIFGPIFMLKSFMVRPLIGLCSRTAAGICCQQWHREVQFSSTRAKGRERWSKRGHICATAVDMHREKRFFPYKLGARALAIACSWQGTCSSWLRKRAGSGQWLTTQPSPPSLPATSAGQQISGRKRRTKPLIIHSCVLHWFTLCSSRQGWK